MKKYNRIFVIVLDSLGIGAMPDSEKFGDVGVDTFGHILDQMGTLEIPNLKKLGMLNLHCGGNMEKAAEPMGRYARLGEASNGKDTMTGHWEMMGIKTEKPFITFTEHGFPPELIAALDQRCDEFRRKPMLCKGDKWFSPSFDSHHLPVSGHGIFSITCLSETGGDDPIGYCSFFHVSSTVEIQHSPASTELGISRVPI